MPDIEEKVYAGLNALTRFKSNLARLECIASNEDLIGHDVTATQGTLSVTETIGDDGKCILRLPKIGIWQITEDLYSTVQSFTLPYYGEYSTMVGGDVFITVLYSEEFNYSTLTLTDGQGHSYSRLVDATGSVQFVVAQYGTWTVSGVVEGVTYTASVTAPTAGEYTINLIAAGGFDYEQWLSAGGVVGTYSSLDDVLVDEKALRQLFTKHASVDYLVETCETELDENVEKIIKTDLCAKWINLRDYALDTLYANEFIADAMDHSGSVDMGETGLVPVMTSNTAPYGTVIGTSGTSGKDKFNAFAQNSTPYESHENASNTYLGYTSVNPICVKKVMLSNENLTGNYYIQTFDVKASNDNGTTWVTLASDLVNAQDTTSVSYFDIDNDDYYLTYAIFGKTGGLNNYTQVGALQFYGSIDCGTKYFLGEWALMPQVPKMTANDAPYGVAIASSEYDGNTKAWKAFNKTDDGIYEWVASDINSQWLGYHSIAPICVQRVEFTNRKHIYDETATITLQGSNDGINWENIGDSWEQIYESSTKREASIIDFNNHKLYLYHRVYFSNVSPGSYPCVGELQFYAWAPKGNVPVMTSNSAPYGVASASNAFTGYDAYKAFDGNTTTSWGDNLIPSGQKTYLQYLSSTPQLIKKVYLNFNRCDRANNLEIVGSNDGTTWTQALNSDKTLPSGTAGAKEYELNNNSYYLYYRIYLTKTAQDPCYIANAQFYGRELKVSVPKMTSNNAPWGEAIKSTEYADYQAYKAFDQNTSSAWSVSDAPNPNYIGYDFEADVVPKLVYLYPEKTSGYDASVKNYKVQGSDDNSTWEDLYSDTIPQSGGVFYIPLTNAKSFRYLRVYIESSWRSNSTSVTELQFYCLDYSEHTERHWIYDHGVEVEEVSSYSQNSSNLTIKDSDSLTIEMHAINSMAEFYKQIDVTNYDLVRVICGKRLTYEASRCGNIGCGNYVSTSINYSYYKAVGSNTPYDEYLDISSVNGEQTVAIYEHNSNVRVISITEWWLE